MKTTQTSTEHTLEHTRYGKLVQLFYWHLGSKLIELGEVPKLPDPLIRRRKELRKVHVYIGRPSGRRHHDSSSKQEAILYAASEYIKRHRKNTGVTNGRINFFFDGWFDTLHVN